MTWISAAILGLVEGLTEFLPVSSTGHLILAKKLMGLHGHQVDSFLVVIQLGALLAAVVYYRKVIWNIVCGVFSGNLESRRLFFSLCIAACPLLICAYFFGAFVKHQLFRPVSVSIALAVGGALMVVVDRWYQRQTKLVPMAKMTFFQAMIVGASQIFSLIPGTSRSMSCMVGGQIAKLDRESAADFAFLLSIPTLGAATLYECVHAGSSMVKDVGWVSFFVGLWVSFFVGLLVISGFLKYVRKFSLIPFGIYRILLAVFLWTAGRFL